MCSYDKLSTLTWYQLSLEVTKRYIFLTQIYGRSLNTRQQVAITDMAHSDLGKHLIVSNHGETVFYIILFQPRYYEEQLVHLCVRVRGESALVQPGRE